MLFLISIPAASDLVVLSFVLLVILVPLAVILYFKNRQLRDKVASLIEENNALLTRLLENR